MRDSISALQPIMVPVNDSLAAAVDSTGVLTSNDSIAAAATDSAAAAVVYDVTDPMMLFATRDDSLSPLHPESLPSFTLYAEGKSGDPIPYSLRRDNVVTLTLLLCFVLLLFSLAHSHAVIAKQMKELFHHSRDDHSFQSNFIPFYIVMAVVNVLLLSIGSYWLADAIVPGTYAYDNPLQVILVFVGAFAAYFMLKWIAYSVVNGVFFGTRKTLQWNQCMMLLLAIEGMMLFPLILIIAYFNISVENALFSFIFILFLNKIMTFYNAWSIFFQQNGRSLQFFLYLCALEITPLLAFGGLWLILVKLLKVNL